MPIKIGNRRIGEGFEPFIIAEMSGNHNQSLERALSIVEAAAAAGAHAIKLQTYTADTMTLDLHGKDFLITDKGSPWYGDSLYDLYQQAFTPWEWHPPLFQRAKDLGLIAFSTPFDDTAVDFLETLDVPCYKIASFENSHIPLIQKVAATGKPIIISTGMASVATLGESVSEARMAGCKDLILLKCTSTYPASPENSNLRTIPHLRSLFNCEVGLSDHTMGIGAAVAAVALGATVIEKHFTLRRSDGGVDSIFSIEPEELSQLVVETSRAAQAIGEVSYGVSNAEEASAAFRRSLYITTDLEVGDALTENCVRAIRPGSGLPAKYLSVVYGMKVQRAVKRGTPLTWDLLK